MFEPFLGDIRTFAFDFPPSGWAHCDGRLLPINQYSSLYSLLGTTYGGDGIVTFGLPDFRGRAPVHRGNGPGLTPRLLGAIFGAEKIPLSAEQMPRHTHAAQASKANAIAATPAANLPAPVEPKLNVYAGAANLMPGKAGQISNTGGAGHDNMQPFLTLNICIALQGLYPPRD